MVKDWQELTRITNGVAFAFERVKLPDDEIIIEGSFELVEIESRLAQTEVLAQLEQAAVGQASMGVSGCD